MKTFTFLSVVFGSFLLLFEGCPTLAVNTCTWGQFQCDNRRCIKSTFRCDKGDDCGDNSDENGCGEVCTNNYFRCKNSKCVSGMHLCDGDNDCGDWSDETQFLCGSGSAPLRCLHCNATSSSNCSNVVECSRSLGYTRCVRFAYVSKGDNIIESTCAKKSDCTPEGMTKQCQKRGGGCKMQCCAKNRCNKATSFDNSTWSPRLTCYQCNIHNWQTCNTNVTCSGNEGYESCFKMTYYRIESGKEIGLNVRTGCATKSNCTRENTLCTGLDGSNCKLQCCDNSNCNVPKIDEKRSPPLTCYQCNNHKWETCDTKVNCSGNEGYDRCFKMSYYRIEAGREFPVVRTGCATESNCTEENTLCTGVDGSNCKLQCCDNSSCNVPQIDEKPKSNLKCYTCSSNKSHQDCDERKVLRTCNDNENRCYDAQVITDNKNNKIESRMFYLGCTLASKCNSTTLDVCKSNTKSTRCTVKCCTGNGCNAGATQQLLVSRFVLVTSVIYAYLFM